MSDEDASVTSEAAQLLRHWKAHATMFCAAAGGFCNLYAMQALVPALQERFDSGPAYAASLLTATTLGLALNAPFAGRIASRYGAKLAVVSALCALVVLTLASAFASMPAFLIALRFAQGACIPVVLTALLANTATTWPEVDQAPLAATYVTGCLLGGVIGRFVPAALMPWGWEAAFIGFAGLQLVAVAGVLTMHPETAARSEGVVTLQEWLQDFLPTLRRDIPAQAVGGFCLLFSQAAATTYIAIRLAGEPFAWSTPELGALYFVFLPALLMVRLTPRVMGAIGSSRTLLVAAAASWAGLVLTLFEASGPILVGLTVFSAAIFTGQTVLANLVSSVKSPNKELASGLYLAAFYAGGSAGALAPAGAWEAFGWVGCLAVIAAIQTLGLVVARKALVGTTNVVN
ncbi:MFS transporter (plasmid) [Sphaerotilaceae bacterium SBD11-9]